MQIELNRPFAANGKVDEFDVRQMKKALNRLGYYQPYEETGITGIPDAGLFNALKSFQKDQGLRPTGTAKPDDETIEKLNGAVGENKTGQYLWRTVGDGKVRSGHAALNWTVRDFANAPDPGDDFNCRCWAEPIEEGLRPVYPELLLIPLLKVGKPYSLWRIWLSNKDTDWVLGNHKSDTRWGNQLKNRDWTPKQITETIKYGKQFPAPNKVNQANTATRYEYRGRFVVQDDQTKEILQVSDKNFIPNKIP